MDPEGPHYIAGKSLDTALVEDANRVYPWQDIGSYRRSQTGSVLDGNADPRFTYTVTAADLDAVTGKAGDFEIPFVHGLGFVPIVDGSFYISNDPTKRPLPFTYHSIEGTDYNGKDPSAFIGINSIDAVYIRIRVVVYDIIGLSFILSTAKLTFKFYCRLEPAA